MELSPSVSPATSATSTHPVRLILSAAIAEQHRNSSRPRRRSPDLAKAKNQFAAPTTAIVGTARFSMYLRKYTASALELM
jgi:hypothetical protein